VGQKYFVGVEYRLHWFQFEEKAKVNANGIELQNISPLQIELNKDFNELCIITKYRLKPTCL